MTITEQVAARRRTDNLNRRLHEVFDAAHAEFRRRWQLRQLHHGEPPSVHHFGQTQRWTPSHRSRDVRAAPWPEAREPGRCYSTIPPAAEPAQVTPEPAQLAAAQVAAAQVSDTADPGDPPPFWRPAAVLASADRRTLI